MIFFFSFADLYKLYHDEVYPARLIFISFLSQNSQGKMVESLRDQGFSPLQFKFDVRKPDLSKLDNVFALQSSESAKFSEDVDVFEKRMASEGIKALFAGY